MAQQWFVICTKPNQEVRASVEVARQGFEVYFPVEQRLRRKKGLDVRETHPLYPRYIFARFDRGVPGWQPIRNTRGVSQIISEPDGRPIPLKDSIMETIKAYREPEEPVETQTPLEAGSSVVITNGPLAGLSGLFVANKKARVTCLLEIMGKSIEVPRNSVRAA